jgi:hypothetical protein
MLRVSSASDTRTDADREDSHVDHFGMMLPLYGSCNLAAAAANGK